MFATSPSSHETPSTWHTETVAIHAHQAPCPVTGAVVPPLFQTSTFALEGIAGLNQAGFFYTRMANPTTQTLEKVLAELEHGQFGLAFASGMGAIHCAVMSVLKPGDHLITEESIYGGSFKLFEKMLKPLGIEVSYVDLQDTQALQQAVKPNTKLLYIETPTNPCLKIHDLKALVAFAKQHGLKTIVDNTIATPILQQPLTLGIDMVVHSVTKYIAGHSDVLAGAIMLNDEALYPTVRLTQECYGATIDPYAAWLTLRGVRTLKLRVRQHLRNAQHVAEYLQTHPSVERVFYPGLPEHPGHLTAKHQMHKGFGGIVSFEVKGGLEAATRFLERITIFTNAVSLGGVESLTCHPARTMYRWASAEIRERIGVTDSLIRLSIGLEHPQDLCDALNEALS
ncbi:MAG: trans-sulfuration enzyme family protein [Vampirovibrionales bacterium]